MNKKFLKLKSYKSGIFSKKVIMEGFDIELFVCGNCGNVELQVEEQTEQQA